MGKVSCTFNGFTNFNNGWAYNYFTTVETFGNFGFGRDSYGHYRCIVLKITTPAFSGYVNKRLEINIATSRYPALGSGETDTFTYMITTIAPNFNDQGGSGGSVTFPTSSLCTGTVNIYSPSQNSSAPYQYNTITTKAVDLAPSTTYYIWLYSPTPYAYGYTYYAGYFSNVPSWKMEGSQPIAVNLLYDDGGVVYIHNGSSWMQANPYIYNGSAWVPAIPYIHNGSSWILSSS